MDDRAGRRRACCSRRVGPARAVLGQRGDVRRLGGARRADRREPRSAPRSRSRGGTGATSRDGLGLVVTVAASADGAHRLEHGLVATACVNVAEVFLAKDTLDAGNIGFGFLVGATGVGLVIGSFFAAPCARQGRADAGLRRLARCSWQSAWGSPRSRRRSGSRCRSRRRGAAGNGAAIVCNQVLVQRGAPDAMRGRALAVMMRRTTACSGSRWPAAACSSTARGARWAGRWRAASTSLAASLRC